MEYWYNLFARLYFVISEDKGEWVDKQVKVGTVKVLSTNEELESLRKPSNIASLKILKPP